MFYTTCVVGAWWLALVGSPLPLSAPLTNPTHAPASIPSPEPPGAAEDELSTLRQRVKEIEDAQRNEIERIQKLIDEIELGHDASPSSWRETLDSLNPELTIFGSFVGRLDDRSVRNDDGDAIDDRFNLREIEIDFRASITPWADGVLLVTAEAETPGEYETGIEEGYVELTQIPGFESNPLALRIRAGRFRPAIGRLNPLHTHSLPQTTRARSLQTFLGEEGFISDGVAALLTLPTPTDTTSLDLTVAIINGGSIPIADANGGEDIAVTGRLGLWWEPTSRHEFEVGGSIYSGRGDASGRQQVTLYAADASYVWTPRADERRHSIRLNGELYYAEIEQPGVDMSPFGGNIFVEYHLTDQVSLSSRFDYTDDIMNSSLETRTGSIYAAYEPSEMLQFRTGYERVYSDVVEIDGLDTLFFEVLFAFGSHQHEHGMRRGAPSTSSDGGHQH